MSFQYLACDTLNVGPYVLPESDGSPGQVLATDGSGGCYWFGLSEARSIGPNSEIQKLHEKIDKLNLRIEELEKASDMVVVPNSNKKK